MCLQGKSFENTVGKGEIAPNEQFLLFPQCFLPFWRSVSHFHQIQNCHLQSVSVWNSLDFVVWERVVIKIVNFWTLPNSKQFYLMCKMIFTTKLGTVKHVFRDHPREEKVVRKVVYYSRWSLNAGFIRLILEGLLYQYSGLLRQWVA